MEKLAKQLAHKIALTLQYDAEREAVVAYGLTALLQILATLLLLGVFGGILGVWPEALLACLAGSSLRKYSGGAHASSIGFCTAFSAVYCLSAALLARSFLMEYYHPVGMGLGLLALYGFACRMVRRVVPVDSPHKPIRSAEKRARMKKGSYRVLCVCAALSLLLYGAGFYRERGRSLLMALSLGVLWQVVTLTSFGARLVAAIDHIFCSEKREVKS